MSTPELVREDEVETSGDVTYLYRHFNDNGELLYVGISLNTVARLAQHREASHWFCDIRNISIERFETRQEALAAETEAIKTESPKHNIAQVKSASIYQLRRVMESKTDLLQRLVIFKPVYRISDAADVLKVSEAKVRALIKQGDLGYMCQRNGGGMQVSGWQLLDYIESLMAKSAEE